jgi:rare lipoprotein A
MNGKKWGLTPFFCAALVGCSSTPQPPAVPPAAAPASGGKFYQNDGPPREVPPNLLQTPDAVPRVEPFHKASLRPYTALGRSYTPLTGDVPLRQRGLASWYGRQFHGARTANGEIYDMFAMTAAHPTMPLPSYAQVTHLKTGASVIVRVNDRGPFHDGRIIDLSYVAAQRLGVLATAEVEVVRLTHSDIAAARWPQAGGQLAKAAPVAPPPAATTAAVAPAAVPVAAPLPETLLPARAEPPAPALVAAAPAAADGPWSVQIGAFALAPNADALREQLNVALAQVAGELAPAERSARVERDGAVYRVLVGAAADRVAAELLAAKLEPLLARQTTLYRRPQ